MVTTIQECEITLALALTVSKDYPAGTPYAFTVDFSDVQNSRTGHDLSILDWQSAEPIPTEQQVIENYNNYLNSQTVQQQEATQADSARVNLQALMTGLQGLSAEDKSYAIACRIMAHKDGATQQVIMGIVDRPTAVAYITNKPEWTGATAATRALVGDVLEMVAGITQVLLIVPTG